MHLIFTYLFTYIVLTFLHRNFHRFVQSRQSFGLHLIHSVSARTVIVASVPKHLQGDRALADYFEACGWTVESVSVCRSIEELRRVLERRTTALLELERAWVEWVGNPVNREVRGYDPEVYSARPKTVSPEPLIAGLDDDADVPSRASTSAATSQNGANGSGADLEASESSVRVHTTRPRPTFRPRWFGAKVDAIEYWERKFQAADEEVKELRKRGRFEATEAAFVTFEDVKDAVSCGCHGQPRHR